eukprot:5680870-Amphidinium_carterae.1
MLIFIASNNVALLAHVQDNAMDFKFLTLRHIQQCVRLLPAGGKAAACKLSHGRPCYGFYHLACQSGQVG